MERLNRVEELFHEAVALAPQQRARFLAETCASEPALRTEVEALIAAHEQPGSFIDTPVYRAFDLVEDELSESLIGTSLGRYEVIRLIKKSGMGEVFLARDTHLPRDVALKLLPLVFTGDDSRLRRFILEAEAVSSLNHPNIITIHEIGHIEDVHFIATEFVDGHTLREKLADRPLDVSEAVEIAIGVTSALVASHAAGIIHRDIKPENIMIRHDGYVKVLDFGLAKLTERADPKIDKGTASVSMLHTDPGTLMGTIGYLSPEQAKSIEVDRRSDLFSLGVVLYEMIAGEAPFNGDSVNEVIGAILKTDPPSLNSVAPDVPAAMQRIVDRALCKDKEDRYQQAEDLLADLKAVKSQIEQPQVIKVPTSFTSRIRSLARWQILLAAIVIVSALLGGANLIRHRRQRSSDASQRGAGINGVGASRVRSLAVLPWSGYSSDDFGASTTDPEVHDAIFARLNAAGNVNVVPQDAVLAAKMTRNNMLIAGRALQADAVLSVCVLRNTDTEGLILRLHLVSVNGGEVLWADTVRQSRSELTVLADTIVRYVSDGLQRLRSAEEYEQRARRHTTNREAYQHYLQGRFLWEQRKDVFARNYVNGFSGPVPSINQMEQARALDPNFALPYVGLADLYKTHEYSDGGWRRGEEYALRAIALDTNLAEAHATLAFIRMFHYWDWVGAEAEFKRALELDAACVTAHQWYALFHALRGNHRESTIEITRARELAPYSISIQIDYGEMQFYAIGSAMYPHVGEWEAIGPLRHTLNLLDSNNGEPAGLLSNAYWLDGAYEAAIEFDKGYNGPRTRQDYAHYKVGICNREGQSADQKERTSWDCARWNAQLNQRDEALDSLERAYRYHHFFIIYLKADPFLKNLRSEPRFQELVRRVGLTP